MSVYNSVGGNITTDDVNEAVDDDNDRDQRNMVKLVCTLIGRSHFSQPKTRDHQKPQQMSSLRTLL